MTGANTLGMRHVQVFMAFTAITIAYILRVNMSVAIVAMTNKTKANPDFPGYILLQIVIGNIAEKFGAKMILALAMALCSMLTLIIPLLAGTSYLVVCVLRILQGAAQGSFYPCITVLLSKWTPPIERNRSMTIAFTGANVGTLISLPLSGFLASSAGGWPSIFYATGGIGLVWIVVWLWIGGNSASEYDKISNAERRYIVKSLNNVDPDSKKLKTPWKYILTSIPLWAICISHLGQNWGYMTLLTQMPNYISSVLKVDIKENGLLSSLPYLCGWGSAIAFSWISDYVNHKRYVSRTAQRILWNSVGLWGSAFSLFILGFSRSTDLTFIVVLLIVTVSLNSGIYNGFLTNHTDMSPNFCGTLMGITNSMSNISSILAPLCVSWIVPDELASDAKRWKYVFVLTASIMFLANLVYIFFSSSEVQKWNEPRRKMWELQHLKVEETRENDVHT